MKLRAMLLLAAACAIPMAAAQSNVQGFQGKPMLPFSMKSLEGKTYTNANLKGKVVLIDFWATWCSPCKKLSPILQRLHEKYAAKGLVVIGADALEQGDPAKLVKRYRDEHKYTYTFTLNNDALLQKLKIQGIPTMLILNKKGVVDKVNVGFNPDREAELESAIKRLLGA